MDSDWSVATLGDREAVCLVTVDLRNPSPVDRRVEVRNRIEGPVLPPRRGGVPEPGWDRDGFEGVVPADDRLVLGYACPGPIDRPPVSVTDVGRASDDGDADDAVAAVRELGDPRPPMDATPAGPATGDGQERAPGGERARPTDATAPPAVDSWLAAVERRIDRGERLADGSVGAAADALDAADDRDVDVTALEARLATDADALRAVSERASRLADRAAAVDVPVAALRRLA
jgi:hypothetical protein